MTEKHYVFLKDNRVEQIALFAEQNEELADAIAHEQGYDDALWIGEDPIPYKFSLYDPDKKTFTDPDLDYLYERGIASENQAMIDERLAREALEKESNV